MTADFRFGTAVKDPDESLPVSLSLYRLCANFWRPNEQFALNEFVRPLRPNGFSYECTTAGTSGSREPRWPTSIGVAVTEGSITWTCRAAGVSGLNSISSLTATSDPAGITIAPLSIDESVKILATYAGGFAGQAYEVIYAFTLNGVPRRARQRVEVALK